MGSREHARNGLICLHNTKTRIQEGVKLGVEDAHQRGKDPWPNEDDADERCYRPEEGKLSRPLLRLLRLVPPPR